MLTAYHPQTDRQIERVNQAPEQYLRCCYAPVTPQTQGDIRAMLSMVCVYQTILEFPCTCLCHQETRRTSQLLPSYALIIALLSGKSYRNYKRLTIN